MKVETKICFYNSYKLQGWRKFVISLMQFTNHTHVHLELIFKSHRLIFLTMDGESPSILRLGLNKKFYGEYPYKEFSIGTIELTNKEHEWVTSYPPSDHWSLIRYQLLRYVNLSHLVATPVTCSTFISDFLKNYDVNIPRYFSPKQLWRYLNDVNYDRR